MAGPAASATTVLATSCCPIVITLPPDGVVNGFAPGGGAGNGTVTLVTAATAKPTSRTVRPLPMVAGTSSGRRATRAPATAAAVTSGTDHTRVPRPRP